MKAFRGLIVATAVVTYALVVLGGVVRVSGSGLGCPDWLLCYGRLLPPLDLHAIIEYSHRTTTVLATTLMVVTAVIAWLWLRRRRDLVTGATLALGLLVVQITLGAITVKLELPPIVVLVHLANAMALLGAVSVTAVAAMTTPIRGPHDVVAMRWARAAAAGTYFLIVSGSLVVASGASGACDAWPLCGGGFSLAFDGRPSIQILHRALAGLIGLLVVISLLMVMARHRREPAVRGTVALTLAALAFQVAVGAAVVTLHLPTPLRALHLALAGAVWAGTVVLAVIVQRLSPRPALPQRGRETDVVRRPARDVVLDYVSLAKPRIIPLLLITALGGMMMAQRGWPQTGLVVLTLLGGALAAAGAGAINCWIDRDLDRAMLRTRRRPLPDGRIAPRPALLY